MGEELGRERGTSHVSSRKKKRTPYLDEDDDDARSSNSNVMQLDSLNSDFKKKAGRGGKGPSKARRKLLADSIAEEEYSDEESVYKGTVKKLLESCAREKITALNCFGQTVIDKVTVDQAKRSDLQDMAIFLEQILHIYAYRVEHAFFTAKSTSDVLMRGRSGRKGAEAESEDNQDMSDDLNDRGKGKKKKGGEEEKINILDRLDSMKIETLKEDKEDEKEEEQDNENVEKSALKSGNVTESYIDRLGKADDIDKFLAEDIKIRRGAYEKFRRNRGMTKNKESFHLLTDTSSSADIVCSTAFQKAISRQRESSAASMLLYNGQWSGDGRLIYLHKEIDHMHTDALSTSPQFLNPDLAIGMHNIICNAMQQTPTSYGKDMPVDPNKTQKSVVNKRGGVNQELIDATRRELMYEIGEDVSEHELEQQQVLQHVMQERPSEIITQERASSVMTNFDEHETKPELLTMNSAVNATSGSQSVIFHRNVIITAKDLNNALHTENKPMFYNTPTIDYAPLKALLKRKFDELDRLKQNEEAERGEREEGEEPETKKVNWKKGIESEEFNLPEKDPAQEMRHVEESKLAYELYLLDEAYNTKPAKIHITTRMEANLPGPGQETRKKWLEPGKYIVLMHKDHYPKNYPADPYSEELMMGLSQSGSSMLGEEQEPDFGSDEREPEPASGLGDEVVMNGEASTPMSHFFGSDRDRFTSPTRSAAHIATVDDIFNADAPVDPHTYFEAADIEMDVEVAPQTVDESDKEKNAAAQLEGRYDNVADVPVIEDVPGVIEVENEVIELKGKTDDAHWKGSAQAKEKEAKKKRKPRNKKPVVKILDMFRPMDVDEKSSFAVDFRFAFANNPTKSLLRKEEVVRPTEAKKQQQQQIITRKASKIDPEAIIRNKDRANYIHFDDEASDEMLQKLIVDDENGHELKAVVNMFSELDNYRHTSPERESSEIVGEAEVGIDVEDNEMFYDTQDNYGDDVPAGDNEAGPSGVEANRTFNKLADLAQHNPHLQKVAKDMYQKMGRIRLEVTQMDIYGHNDSSAYEDGLYMDDLQGPIKAPHIDTAIMKREIGAVLGNDKYSYNAIKTIYEKCKEQKAKREMTMAQAGNETAFVPDYGKDTLEMSHFITEQPEYYEEEDEMLEGAAEKLGMLGSSRGKKRASLLGGGHGKRESIGLLDTPPAKRTHLTEGGEAESPVKGVHTFCSMASALYFRLPENERKCARSNYFVMSLHRCNEKRMKIVQEKPPKGIADVTRADGTVASSSSKWMSDFCFANADDVKKREFERTAYLADDSDAYSDEEEESGEADGLITIDEDNERDNAAGTMFRPRRVKRMESIFANIPQPERTILEEEEEEVLEAILLPNGEGAEQAMQVQVERGEGEEQQLQVQRQLRVNGDIVNNLEEVETVPPPLLQKRTTTDDDDEVVEVNFDEEPSTDQFFDASAATP